MRHVRRISKVSLPAKAAFIVRVEDKGECKTNPNVSSPTACKNAVKSAGVYEIIV